MLRLASACFALAATALVTAPLSAQCIGPDNLDTGVCCGPAIPALPTFPAITMPGLGICWDSCNPAGQACTLVTLSAPFPVACGQFNVNLNLQDCSGNPLLKSNLVLDYTRTWNEFAPLGAISQVWRFVVKADVSAASTGGPPCQVPSCLAVHPTAFYYGYLDYTFNCSGTWSSALVLYHGCDRYQHLPGLSNKPGVFHPQRSFALVAPNTTANPFIPALLPAPGGAASADAIRLSVNPFTAGCNASEKLLGGILQPLASACVCPFSFVPPQTTARHVDLVGACGSFARSLNAFPSVPWLENLTISLGTWTTGASYPGNEAVWVDEGTYLQADACDPTGLVGLYAEIKYGATTQGGFPAIDASGLPLDKFTDLASNYSKPITAITAPFVGSVLPTRDLVYANVP